MKRLFIASCLALAAFSASAIDIRISAQETYAKVQQSDSRILFIDVRDPVEIMFIGFTDVVSVNIPYMLVDRTQWNEQKAGYRLSLNQDFLSRVKAELEKRGWGSDTEIITMCRSGSERGEPSADYLRENGYPNARFVVHGFQGSISNEGPHAGFRLSNGWQNSGLPWSMKLNPTKMYRVDKP